MNFSEYLELECIATMGCTEPAAIALAVSTAAARIHGEITSIMLKVDPKMYKNCYAVGIPNSGHKTGIVWAIAIGASIECSSMGLECFKAATVNSISKAEKLISKGLISVDVLKEKADLFIDCTITGTKNRSRVVIEDKHTKITLIETDGKTEFEANRSFEDEKPDVRRTLAEMDIDEIIKLAKCISKEDENFFKNGIEMNRNIAKHGLSLLPKRFINMSSSDKLSYISTLVCAGVYARMWGEEMPVMSLAGSGNKGIVVFVPMDILNESGSYGERLILEATAMACMITSATTHHLGTLSAVCGCSNAAGIGLAAALVYLDGGSAEQISLAMTNMVGNVTGMICDGAKIGCALKTMTSVDSAFRASSLAMSGLGIPPSDGIVGNSGISSLANLGRIATKGMISTDDEILAIMREKMFK